MEKLKIKNIQIQPIDLGPVGEWEIYKFAYPEQIDDIKAQVPEAVNLFVSDNIETFTKQAYSFVRKYSSLVSSGYQTDDLILQLYIDLPFMDFSSENAFHSFLVNRVFPWAGYGGFQSRLGKRGSHDKPWQTSIVESMNSNFVCGDEVPEDKIAYYGYTKSVAQEYIDDEENARRLTTEKIKNILSKYLSPKELNYICDRLNGDTYTEALAGNSRQAGYSLHRSAYDKLIVNYAAILSELRENGCVALESVRFDALVPEEYSKAVERLEKRKENERKKWARRAERLKQQRATKPVSSL